MVAPAAQALLAARLLDPACYDHPVRRLHAMETHISHVLLTGDYAYKIKKPLDLGFLDFSALEARRFYCEEEVRLNRRLAPDHYLGVVAITGSPACPKVNGPGVPFEYAVKMRQFPEAALLDRVQAHGKLTAAHADAMAREIAAFHARCARAGTDTPFGSPECILEPAGQNFRQIMPLLSGAGERCRLDALERWSAGEFDRLRQVFTQRKREGFVRECHGDLHLGNMFLDGNEIRAFDCIEFNPDLRWIDVMSEAAFLVMDLYHRDHPDLARRFLNAYLEITGDYAGVEVLRYYLVYRALVRAKIAAIRAGQKDAGKEERRRLRQEFGRYLKLAEAFSRPQAPVLIITFGLSGSGKSALTRALIERLDMVRLRSDVERKRLFGLESAQRSGSGPGAGLYTDDATRRTYDKLIELTRAVLKGGWSAVVDATFLARRWRDRFRDLARELGVCLRILDFQVSETTLRARIARRRQKRRDASEATVEVLEAQLKSREPLGEDERIVTIAVDGERTKDRATIESTLARLRDSQG